MGIVLSPDDKNIWFTEIIGNNIGSFDIDIQDITEFPTGDLTRPYAFTFDERVSYGLLYRILTVY